MRAMDMLDLNEMFILKIDPDANVRRHNPNGCDLCNRTGYHGRTMSLEALLIEGNDKARNEIYQAMMTNTAKVLDAPGVTFYSRSDNIRHLVKEGLADPRVALLQLQSQQEG